MNDLGHSRLDACVAFLRDLIRIPSRSGEEGPIGERVVAEYRACGCNAAWTDEAGNGSAWSAAPSRGRAG